MFVWRKLYPNPAGNGMLKEWKSNVAVGDLTFAAIGALLGVKIFRQNAEHIVTLDANTVKHWLSRRRSFLFGGMNLRLVRLGSHEQILA